MIASLESPPPAEPTITMETVGNAKTPIDEDHDDKYGVPTLEELGFDTDGLKPPVWIGGETEALARLERHLERKAWVASFGRPKMTPQSLLASQTGLSPYLRFGCLSTRLFYYQLTGSFKFFNKKKLLFSNFTSFKIFIKKLKRPHHLYLSMDNYYGANFSIVLPQIILTLIKWWEIPFVSRCVGIRTLKHSQSGLMGQLVILGLMRSWYVKYVLVFAYFN